MGGWPQARRPGGRPLIAPQLGGAPPTPAQAKARSAGMPGGSPFPNPGDHCRSQEEREGVLSELAFFSKQNDTYLGWTT